MPKKQTIDPAKLNQIDAYTYPEYERSNIPPVGMAKYDTAASPEGQYNYDPHIDPSLQWAGKAEGTSFTVPTTSIHIHESIKPHKIIRSVQTMGDDYTDPQGWLFESDAERAKRRNDSIEFYQHKDKWTNRLIAGDSLVIMNSLLEKEGMAGQVQMVYIDPPYGIKYGSNFQPFVNKRDVKDKKDEDLSTEPEMIKAFRDTWELGIHSYLTYLRDRLLLARELLAETGSVFVQISDENVHHVREICDEVYGVENFVGMISFAKTTGFSSKTLSSIADYIVWYAKDKVKIKYRQLYKNKIVGDEGATKYKPLLSYKAIPFEILNKFGQDKIASLDQITSQGSTVSSTSGEVFNFNGKEYTPPVGMHWKTSIKGLNQLAKECRIVIEGNMPRFIRLFDDYPVFPISNIWSDIGGIQNREEGKIYVVQTANMAIQRCLLMTTDPGDLVLDITCGSGTTAYVAEQWGRRWITCDTSRIAITLAKKRLMTSTYDYYKLAHPEQGVGSGFIYKTVPHVTLKSIANNEPAEQETLYDQPEIEKRKVRISGPFTVEALPAPAVKPLEDADSPAPFFHENAAKKQSDWMQELKVSGILGRKGEKIKFTRIEPLENTKFLHADAEIKIGASVEAGNGEQGEQGTGGKNNRDTNTHSLRTTTPIPDPQSPIPSKRAVICFAGETRPLDTRLVNQAIYEAQHIVPEPSYIIFAAFQFDPTAAKVIDDTNWPGVVLLKVQMNPDLMTGDLKKKVSGSQSFWLVGQPDVELVQIEKGNDKGKYKVKVKGFDYYDIKQGIVESGNADRIAMWMLDTDYDGMCVEPKQVFFPMEGANEGWGKLAKTLKAEIDQDLIEKYRGTESLPFEVKDNTLIAVKIVDDRGIESLKVIPIGGTNG